MKYCSSKSASGGLLQLYAVKMVGKRTFLGLPAVLMVLEYIWNDLGRTKSIYLEVNVGDDDEHGPTA